MANRVRKRLEQLKKDLTTQTIYKEGLPGSALDIVNALLEDLAADEKENNWIPVKTHNVTDQEREEKGLPKTISCYIDSPTPEDEQKILVTNGKDVWEDMCCFDSEEYYLDSGYDWLEITAWRPLPEPYKED